MGIIVGMRAFPWVCSNKKCESGNLTIRSTHNPRDPQEIRVTCEDCGSKHTTSGEPFFVDQQAGTCRKLTEEEKGWLADKFKRFQEEQKAKRIAQIDTTAEDGTWGPKYSLEKKGFREEELEKLPNEENDGSTT